MGQELGRGRLHQDQALRRRCGAVRRRQAAAGRHRMQGVSRCPALLRQWAPLQELGTPTTAVGGRKTQLARLLLPPVSWQGGVHREGLRPLRHSERQQLPHRRLRVLKGHRLRLRTQHGACPLGTRTFQNARGTSGSGAQLRLVADDHCIREPSCRAGMWWRVMIQIPCTIVSGAGSRYWRHAHLRTGANK